MHKALKNMSVATFLAKAGVIVSERKLSNEEWLEGL